jgi:putative transposase
VLRRPVEPGQYLSIRYSERLAEAGIQGSVGSKGDSYDNALAETINGLFKTELIHRRAPWKTKEVVELATLERVSWFNHHVVSQDVVPVEAESEGGRFVGDSGVRPAEVVVLHPGLQLCRPDVRAGIAIGIGPFAQKRLDEAFGLAVGTRRVRPRALVLDAEPAQQLGEGPGLVSRAVVGHHSLDGHTELALVAQRRDQEVAGTATGLVGQHLAEPDAGVVINGHMQRLPAGTRRVARTVARHAMPRLSEAATRASACR